MAYEIFDSSVLKKQADGDIVLSSFLDDGEELVPSSFTPKPAFPEFDPELNVDMFATRVSHQGNRFVFTLEVPQGSTQKLFAGIIADEYRGSSTVPQSYPGGSLVINGEPYGIATYSRMEKVAAAPNVDTYVLMVTFPSDTVLPTYTAADMFETSARLSDQATISLHSPIPSAN